MRLHGHVICVLGSNFCHIMQAYISSRFYFALSGISKSLKRLGYGLNERRISIRFQGGRRGFSLLHTSRLGLTPSAFYSTGNGGNFPGVKTAREWRWHIPPLRMRAAVPPSPPPPKQVFIVWSVIKQGDNVLYIMLCCGPSDRSLRRAGPDPRILAEQLIVQRFEINSWSDKATELKHENKLNEWEKNMK